MKISNYENGQHVIYVQQKNIKAILKYEDKIPTEFLKATNADTITTDYGQGDEEFIRLEGEKLTNYISSLTWIPDYHTLRDLSDENLALLIEEAEKQLDTTTNEYLALPETASERVHHDLLTTRSKLNEQIKDLKAFSWSRKGEYDEEITIPTVINAHELSFGIQGDKYTLGRSLDGKKLLLGKTDGTEYQPDDSINMIDFQAALSMYMLETNIISHCEGNGTIAQYTDPSHKYFVTEYSFTPTSTKELEEDPLYIFHTPERKQTPLQKLKSIFTNLKPTKRDTNN